MNFNDFVGKKVVLSAMPNLRIEGKVLGIVQMTSCFACADGCSDPWLEIELETTSKDLDGKHALVDCAMITFVVGME
jgi:hypothetical protein